MVIAVSAFAGGCVAHEFSHVPAAQAQAPRANVPLWEYKVATSFAGFSDAELNSMGKQGWELVGCPGPSLCHLKRPL
jgi:hypothetical protein